MSLTRYIVGRVDDIKRITLPVRPIFMQGTGHQIFGLYVIL